MTQSPLPPTPGIAMLQQQLQQGLAAGQFQLVGTGPPQSGQPSGLLECECCGQMVAALPYTHTDGNTTWSYCQECHDAGCIPSDYCELDEYEELGDCVVCKRTKQPLSTRDPAWCCSCFGKYAEYLETHPIPPKDRFTPVYRGEHQPLAHMPAYMYPPDQWDQANFKPEYILDPASAPKPTRKKAHIVTQQPQSAGLTEQDVLRLIREANGGDPNAQVGPTTAVTIDAILDSIDPADSESALKLFHWLRDNHRLHKVATLDLQGAGGYLFMYQEPPGSDREGYTAGGTDGDRIVDEALSKAGAGGKPLKGLCRKCYSAISKVGDGPIEADTPRAGTDPAACGSGGAHEFAG